MGGEGNERPPRIPEKTHFSREGGAESGALADLSTTPDPYLARLIEAWPDLPEAVRRDILEMIEAG